MQIDIYYCWIEMQTEFISNGRAMRECTHRIVGTSHDADDNEIIKGIVYSPKGNLSMEKVIDTLTLDGIVACFIDLICSTKIKQYCIVFDADPSEEYMTHLKLSTSYFRSRIMDIISGGSLGVGLSGWVSLQHTRPWRGRSFLPRSGR